METPLIHCSDGTWCCGKSNQTCCAEHAGFNLTPTLVAIGTPISTTTISTVTVSTITVTPTSNSNGSSNDSSTKLAIGVGLGVPLGIIAVATFGVGFWWGRRRTATTRELGTETKTKAMVSRSLESDGNAIHEVLASNVAPVELPEGRNPHEGVSGSSQY